MIMNYDRQDRNSDDKFGFSMSASSKTVCSGDCNNDTTGSRNMDAKTGNTYISVTMIERIELSTANMGLLTMAN